MRLLVTGGAGFIGSHLVDLVVNLGGQVVVVDDLSSGRVENLPTHRSVQFINKSFWKCEARDFTGNFDAVVHLAALPSVATSWEQPMRAHDSNLSLTLHAITLASELRIKRVIFASSAAVYGKASEVPTKESSQTKPSSPYGLQKLTSELYGQLFAGPLGPSFVSLRFFNVFGSRQPPSSPYSGVISNFLAAMQRNQSVNITGDGEQTRDFVYVKDVAAALQAAVTKVPNEMRCSALNIGTGVPTSVLELRREMIRFFPDADKAPVFLPTPSGDIPHSTACITAATEVLEFSPRYSLRDGLAELFQDSVKPSKASCDSTMNVGRRRKQLTSQKRR
jgi:UDP-glucose 4-epimerase